jgi:hypothetical protein
VGESWGAFWDVQTSQQLMAMHASRFEVGALQ